MEDEHESSGLEQGEADCQVPRRLRELPLSSRPLISPLLEFRNDGRKELDNDRRCDVGHDTETEDRGTRQTLTREEVQEGEDTTLLRSRFQLLDRLIRGARNGYVCSELVYGEDHQGEKHLASQIPHLEDVLQISKHSRCSQRSSVKGFPGYEEGNA